MIPAAFRLTATFRAGLINAWTESGTRPEFDVVTGVSTGALSAPFVFLGPDYDDDLREIYGGFPPDQIFKPRLRIDILPKASVADSRELADLIAEFLDDAMLSEIARAHLRRRRLLIQTSHLDAQPAMISDIGAIAASGAVPSSTSHGSAPISTHPTPARSTPTPCPRFTIMASP
ncbi:MAG: patatin-like phospholipase family protein [Pseudomonadota bacterium]